MTDTNKKAELVEKLNALIYSNCDIDAQLNESDLGGGFNNLWDSLEQRVNEQSEIIYYSTAIDYLKNNDASLTRSLAIASEYGFKLEDLNSEKLASLLNYEDTLANLYGIKDEIEAIFDEFNEL